MKYALLLFLSLFSVVRSFAQPQHLVVKLDHYGVTVEGNKLKPVSGTKVDHLPMPPHNLSKTLLQYIKLPTEEAIGDCIEGKVLIQFLIDSTGHVGDVSVKYGVHQILDARAINAVKNMPAWVPGTNEGRPTGVYFTLPFNFEARAQGCRTSNTLYNEALGLYKRGKQERALNNFAIIARRDYEDVEALFNIAVIHISQNRPEQACPYLKQILDVRDGKELDDRNVAGLISKYCSSVK